MSIMGEPSESIANAFEAQATELDKLARDARKTSAMHEGARDVLTQVTKGLGQFTEAAKAEAAANSSLNEETRALVVAAVAKAMLRTGAGIAKAHASAHGMIYVAQGQAKAYEQQSADMRKKAELRRATARINQETVDNAHPVKAKKKPAKKRTPKKKAK